MDTSEPLPLPSAAERVAAAARSADACAARLRALARSLRADPAMPAWLAAALDSHLTAATVAADQLGTAAALLGLPPDRSP